MTVNVTIVSKQMARGCIFVAIDGGESSGAGRRECVSQQRLAPLPKSSVSELFENDGEAVIARSSHGAAAVLSQWTSVMPGAKIDPWSVDHRVRVPSYVTSSLPPEADADLLLGRADGARAPVLPSLFLPGFPKSSTTWLYSCLTTAFTPVRAGCGHDPSGWNASACPRRFLLSPVGASRWPHDLFTVEALKETFFFGGNRQRRYREDLLSLHGPDPTHGARPGEPPLWPWENKHQRIARLGASPPARRHAADGAARPPRGARAKASREALARGVRASREALDRHNGALLERIARLCSNSRPPCSNAPPSASPAPHSQRRRARQAAAPDATAAARAPEAATAGALAGPLATELGLPSRQLPLSDCAHTACHRTVRGVASTYNHQCAWEEDKVGVRLQRNDSYCLMSILPWATHRHEFRLVVGDFTPNYLCDPEALSRLHRMAPHPERLRFIVLMREPAARALSEWSMFALQWGWDTIGDFEASFAMRVRQLRACNSSLFRNVAALRSLPTVELSRYLAKCWNHGGSMMYATNSLYSVCVLHALRLFRREQFLFLRYEDLMAMNAPSLLTLIGRFSGLYAGSDLIDASRADGKCDPQSSRRAPSTYRTLSPSEKVLYNRSKAQLASGRHAFSAFFAPYNELLVELVGHQAIGWHGSAGGCRARCGS